MRESYTKIYSRILLFAAIAMCISFTMLATPRSQKGDTTYLHLQKLNKSNKPNYKTFHFTVPASKPVVLTINKQIVPDDKQLLSNVQVFPTLVTDQVNVKYTISRNSQVNIKIVDVLGNEVLTLLSRRIEPGEQKFTYSLENKLNTGFYFVRVVVGTESQIRRISIL